MDEQILRIGLIQADVVWEDRTANLAHYGELLSRLWGKIDLAVLPELFTTASVRRQLADVMEGKTVRMLKRWASVYQIALTGSFLAVSGEKFFNRMFFVAPGGNAWFADKRHLFRMSGEDRILTAGDKKLIVTYRGWKICSMVCYDLRFPVWSRNIDNAYDLLIYSANWPEARKDVWDKLLPARAIENMAYVCGTNRTGIDANQQVYHGGSAVYSPQGVKLIDAGREEELAVCELKRSDLVALREAFPVWKDADAFYVSKKTFSSRKQEYNEDVSGHTSDTGAIRHSVKRR